MSVFTGDVFNKHNPQDDELFAESVGPDFGQDKGAIASAGGLIGPGKRNKKAGSQWDPAGGGEATENGYRVGGTNAYDKDVDRYRNAGTTSQGRAAVTLDQTQGDQSRGMQMGALGLMQGAARGNAPSRAATLGASATDNTARGALSGLAGGRGPGAAVAQAGQAGSAAAGRMSQQNAAITDLRAGEMAKNQSDLVNSANQLRTQDDQAATQNAKFEAQQRALNESREQGFENLGLDTRKTQQQGAVDYERLRRQKEQSFADARRAWDEGESQRTDEAVNTSVAMAMRATGSDERIKTNVRSVTMGSLSGLSRFMHGR